MTDKMKVVLKNLLAAILILAVIVPLVLGFRALKIPSWPILVFIFYYSTFLKMDFSKLKETTVGSLIGIFLSFSGSIFGLIDKGFGELVFLLLLVCYIAALVSGKNKYINNAGNLYLLCRTAVIPDGTMLENILPVAVGTLGVATLLWLLKKAKRFRSRTK